MIVELLIFSGRPNPSWRTTAAESAQIVRRIAYDSLVPAAPPPGVALGYGGFSLRNFEIGEGDGQTSEIRVRGGVIVIATVGITRYCADVAELEDYLLTTARIRQTLPAGVDLRRYR